jgi:8-oxo-dGTP pyrophosphatase MutT (NUDIX family)
MVHERIAGRALLMTPGRKTLLVLGQDPSNTRRGQFYWTPGGGLDPGESLEEATRRELCEEVGHVAGDLGAVVLERVSEFDFGGRRLRQTESFFLLEIAEPFAAAPKALSALEDDAIIDFHWLTPDEMRSTALSVYPSCLADLIDEVATNGRPSTPWVDNAP